MSMDREKYINLFIDESKENLLALNDYLLELEKGEGDLRLLSDIFRVAHTLKGMSSTMGFNQIAELTHEMENLLDLLRNAQIIISAEIIDILFSCLDSLEAMLENITGEEKEVNNTNLLQRLKRVLKSSESQVNVLKKEPAKKNEVNILEKPIYSKEEKEIIIDSLNKGYFASEIQVFLADDCVMKSLRASMIINAIESKAKILKIVPEKEKIEAEYFDFKLIFIVIHSIEIEKIVDSINSISEIKNIDNSNLVDQFKNEIVISEEKIIPNLPSKIIPKYNQTEKNILIDALDSNLKCYEVYISLDSDTIMKSIRVTMVMNTLDALGCQIISSFPSSSELIKENKDNHFIVTIISEKEAKDIYKDISNIAEIKEIEVLEIFKNYFVSEDADITKKRLTPEFNDYEKMLILEAQGIGKRILIISVNLMHGTVMKFARFVLVTKKLELFGDIIKSIPSQEEIESENFDDSFQIVFVTSHNDSEIINAISSVAEVNNISDLFSIVTDEKTSNITISKQTQTYYDKKFETDTIEKKAKDAVKVIVKKAEEIESKPQADIKEDKTSKKPIAKKNTIRVDTDRLDQLVNMVEELVIIRSTLNRIALEKNDQSLTQIVRKLNLISSNLQNSAMKLRMMPVENIFNRFPRMIRDISKTLNKEIEFFIEGEDTEMDRTIIDEIGDPLVHLLRNSADHGIELPDERLRAGKSKAGVIKLIAKHEGNSVLIIVEDDGGGINVERVKEKALEKKIITKEQALSMSQDEALQLIFMAGFSTMETTTELSGRGVGMDAVLSKVKALGGVILINSQKGIGSRFTVKLPLTLAIMEVLIVRLSNELYAIPISYVEEVREISPLDIKHINNVKVTIVRDKTIPLVELNKLLNVPEKLKPLNLDFSEPDFQELLPVIIVRTEEGNKTSGFLVDSIVGQDDVVIKPLSKIASDKKSFIAGTANLGDGNLALILNVTNIT